jgi:transcription elongation factor Elf1
MIALYDFIPRYCPGCGSESPVGNSVRDYLGFASCGCRNCGVTFQLAPYDAMLDAADANGQGDLRRFAPGPSP